MIKPIYLFFVIATFSGTRVVAQDTSSRDSQVQQALGMSKEQFRSYADSLKLYDKRITEVVMDSSLDKNAKGVELNRALQARKNYIKRHLSSDQQKKLSELNAKYRPVSPRIKNEKQHAEILRQRGVKMITDSTKQSLKTN